MERLHILFWLIKNLSWDVVWQPPGLLVVVLTLGIALVIARRTRPNASGLARNLAHHVLDYDQFLPREQHVFWL